MIIHHSLLYELINIAGRYSSLFALYYLHHRQFAHLVARPETDIVIEGYPRCTNSFSVLAFEKAQQRPLHIAHHLHATAQITLGIKYGIPIITLIRFPLDAVASLITRHPGISARQALRQYIYFYEYTYRCLEHLVLADFTTVTTNYGKVIETVNRRFNTDFKLYSNSSSNDRTVFDEIDILNIMNEDGAKTKLARPSATKSELLREAKQRVSQEDLLKVAQNLYDRFSSVSV